MDGVLGHHGASMDLIQHRVGNVDHLAIHNENINNGLHALVDADYRALISHITPLDPQNKQTFEKV